MNIEQPTSNSEQPMAEGRGGDLAFGGYEGGGQGLRGHYRSVNGVLMAFLTGVAGGMQKEECRMQNGEAIWG